MHCPRCQAELPRSEATGESGPKHGDAGEPEPTGTAASTPEKALRADTPPAPCPQCGWSTMWNE